MKKKGLASVVVLFLAGSPAAPAFPAEFKVIVNAKVAGNSITKDVLAQIFLGKIVRWGDRSMITPVDLSATSSVRAAFSESVLGMPVPAVQNQWMRRIAPGIHPPTTRSSDADVIELVGKERGSIGYVSDEASLPATVRAVSLQ